MTNRKVELIKLFFISGCFISTAVNSATVFIDDFTIIKNGNVLFQDTFNNGLAPADTGGNTQAYNVIGGPFGVESGGKLAIDASLGQTVQRPDAGTMQRQGARVLTNIDPTRPTKGLRLDDTFSVTGLFDLSDLSGVRERYGVRLTDGGLGSANDSVGLSVMRTSSNQMDIVFHSYDQTAFLFSDLDSVALESNHDQISLSLSRLDTSTNLITASFAYVDAGVVGEYTTFAATDSIFNGEDATRAQFIHLAPVPVPAAIWLFFSGLIGLTGIARYRKI